ncbi:hypothetical protein EBU71_05355 [bacterium]|jgi:peptidoglycan hydrolase CwlO-like protein|nr:hypothetical protein [Candidatus Elulimicrobium humile]
MEEQQQHLTNLLNQRKSLLEEINSFQEQINAKRELFFKVQGAIEYLQQIGTTISETEIAETEESIDGGELPE